mmetsp:Transcript_9601/g.17833  ORF Transcript_9601/g.17833 Transcript_9601/m.17833 type:complete len:211 (+) Transcript_9601:63-695(+)
MAMFLWPLALLLAACPAEGVVMEGQLFHRRLPLKRHASMHRLNWQKRLALRNLRMTTESPELELRAAEDKLHAMDMVYKHQQQLRAKGRESMSSSVMTLGGSDGRPARHLSVEQEQAMLRETQAELTKLGFGTRQKRHQVSHASPGGHAQTRRKVSSRASLLQKGRSGQSTPAMRREELRAQQEEEQSTIQAQLKQLASKAASSLASLVQ